MIKWFIHIGLMLAGVICALGQDSAALAKGQGKQDRPNIIILLADDLGYADLGSYGHPSIETPALDRLALEGQRWTDFYANAPICSPSRGALLTGKLPIRSGLYGKKRGVLFPGSRGGFHGQGLTIAQALRDAGYDTAMLGKWHLGDQVEFFPTRHGFDSWLGVPYSNDMDWLGYEGIDWGALTQEEYREVLKTFFEARVASDRKSSWWNVPLIRSERFFSGYGDKTVQRPVKQETLTKRYTEEAVSYIKAHAKRDTPFFLYLAYNMPHAPVFSSKKFNGKSLNGPYGDAVEEIDWSVGEIRSALEKAGLEQNTLIVFCSDNGPEYKKSRGGTAGLLKGEKGTTFEGGMRVPGIFWQPGRVKPGVVHGVGSLMDLYATALSMAGVTFSVDEVDSIDLSPAFEGHPSPRKSLLYYSGTGGNLLGYREGDWKVSITEDGRAPSDVVALYNLAHDPGERTDLSKDDPDLTARLVADAKEKDAAIRRAPPLFDQ